jgi:tetratricopeptide (TPR) repeat protein
MLKLLFWLAGLIVSRLKQRLELALENLVESVLERAIDKKTRAALWLNLGEAYRKQNNLERAKSAFEALARESPGSDYAKSAKGNLYEVTYLNVGQATPQFAAKTMDGKNISPADLKGKVVLLNFWATW